MRERYVVVREEETCLFAHKVVQVNISSNKRQAVRKHFPHKLQNTRRIIKTKSPFGTKICTNIYLFRVARSFPRASLLENFSRNRTENVRGQISMHIFAPNGALFIYLFLGVKIMSVIFKILPASVSLNSSLFSRRL